MKQIFFFLLIIFTSLSCDPEDCCDSSVTGDLKVNFKLKYDGKDLKMFDDYTYPTGEKFHFSRFSFFTSDIKLKNSNNGLVDILDIEYHNLTNSFTGNNSGYSFVINDVVEGEYKSIQFGLGVPADDNGKTPSAFSSDNVLSNQSEYWGDWKSYIFTRTEGMIDLDKDGSKETGFSLHTGANDAYRTIELPIATKIEINKQSEITIEIDLRKEFGDNPIYNIKENPQIHSRLQQPFVIELIDNLKSAFKSI
jgi:hypothetical protein